MKVQEMMTRDPSWVTPDATVREAAQLMRKENVGAIPVVDSGSSRKLMGVITDRDIAVRCVADGRDGSCRVQDAMSSDSMVTCSADEDINKVMDAMGKEQVRRIPIVDERGMLMGIISQADLATRARDEGKVEDTVEQISKPSQHHAQ